MEPAVVQAAERQAQKAADKPAAAQDADAAETPAASDVVAEGRDNGTVRELQAPGGDAASDEADAAAGAPAEAEGRRKRQHTRETGQDAPEAAAVVGASGAEAPIGPELGPAEPAAKKQKATAALLSHLGNDEDDE